MKNPRGTLTIAAATKTEMHRFYARMTQSGVESWLESDILGEKYIERSCKRLLARDGDRVVGILSMSHNGPWRNGPPQCIDVVIVDREYRRRGIARMLIERAMGWLLPRTKRIQIIAEHKAISRIIAGLPDEARDHIKLEEPWRVREMTVRQCNAMFKAKLTKVFEKRLRPRSVVAGS
jgi:GNAT superfamily N-acetyltransferase